MTDGKNDPKGLFRRVWTYQHERFPVFRTGILVLAFSSSSVTVSAHLAARSVPSFYAYLAAFFLAFSFFWQLRAADEYKDQETDLRYRPERPVPRGLVSLRLVISLGFGSVALAALAAFLYLPALLVLTMIVWGWMALMTAEFFAPDALHASPALLLVSHMLIMPLIDGVLTACEWLPHGFRMPEGLWTFLLLSLANGCIFEFCRKIWAPENEREGVETYSAAWGIARSLRALFFVWCVAFSALVMLSLYFDMLTLFLISSLFAGLPFLYRLYSFYQNPTAHRQKALDNSGAIWVVLCYLLAAMLPFFRT